MHSAGLSARGSFHAQVAVQCCFSSLLPVAPGIFVQDNGIVSQVYTLVILLLVYLESGILC